MDKRSQTIKALLFSPYALFLCQAEGGAVLGVGPWFSLKTGYDETHFAGRTLADLDLWPSLEPVIFLESITKKRQRISSWETCLVHADGEKKSYVLSADFFQHDGETWALFSGYENSERKEIEHALNHSEYLYREAQEIARLGHWELDLVSQKLTWSEEIFRIFDMDPSRFSASYEAFLDLIHPDDREMVDRAYRQSVEKDTPYDVVHRLRMNDGRIKYVHERGRTLRNEKNEPARSIGTVQDITALKESEQAREKIERQLLQSQKLEAIGTLAGGIAHDFNNILFAILGFAEISMDLTVEDNELNSYMKRIFEAGSRAKELVNQILTFCRKNSDQKKPLMIRLIVKEALKLIRSTLPSSVQITEHLESSSRISADATQIHQIVMNLCSNSAHAMKNMDSGNLTIELRDIEVDAEFGSRFLDMVPGRYVNLVVSDTGHGMDADVRDRMFEPFFTTKVEGEGTGLGLSVVHGIVKSHGGQIMVYSEPGKGATVKIFFPVIDESAAEAGKDKPVIKGGDERILLVDDERVLADLMRSMLSSLGYRVTAVSDSPLALETFKNAPEDFDLVITDMNMPRMNGLTLAGHILAVKSAMKVIMSTGFSDRISEDIAKESGIKALVFKPMVKKDLAEVVRNVLDAET